MLIVLCYFKVIQDSKYRLNWVICAVVGRFNMQQVRWKILAESLREGEMTLTGIYGFPHLPNPSLILGKTYNGL